MRIVKAPRAFLLRFQCPRGSRERLKARVAKIVTASGFEYVRPPKWLGTHFYSYVDGKGKPAGPALRAVLFASLDGAGIAAELSRARQQIVR